MAPADLRKEGSAYDLTTIGTLVASEQIKAIDVDKYIIMGELSLDGSTTHSRALPPSKPKKRVLSFFFQSKM
jgi:magnesium chelatase family protein